MNKSTTPQRKVFRFHRGTLTDSLATTVQVSGLDDIKKTITEVEKYPEGYLSNIHIKDTLITDSRLPEEWGGQQYFVVADFNGFIAQCIGMCNFYE